MFIVHRSRIPLRLTAGKFGTFSLEMFGIVRYIYEKNTYSLSIYAIRLYLYMSVFI